MRKAGEPIPAEQVAKICHQANKAFCEFLGDTSQPNWEDAPNWQQMSAIQGVNFHRDNVWAGDSASHENWMKQKVSEGWVHGPVKDPEASPPTHPCLVPFEQLPPEQQFKDKLFRTLVHACNVGG